MGGNAFEDTQKLTQEQYIKLTSQLLDLISPICLKIEPYIPLPQKQIHGDVDFLLILKPGFTLINIVELMKLQKGQYIFNNNQTANTVFHKKQIDFNVAANEQQFKRCRFYKSYSGMGAFLGLMLPSKLVKFNEDGLFCCCYHQHIKLEFRVSQDVNQIMKFYGLDPERYWAGFERREELFEFLINTRFLNCRQFSEKKPKWSTKLINFFQQFLLKNMEKFDKLGQRWEDPVSEVLKYFNKEKEFEVAWKTKLGEQESKKERASKWNGMHIMKLFGVQGKDVNELKHKFQNSFHTKAQYSEFIDSNSFGDIAKAFAEICHLVLDKEDF